MKKKDFTKCILAFLFLFSLTACTSQNPAAPEEENVVIETPSGIRGLGKIEMTGMDLKTGKAVGNEILTEKVNVLMVWQPDCYFCEEEAKAMEKILPELENTKIIGLVVTEDKEAAQARVEEWGLTFENILLRVDQIYGISPEIQTTPSVIFVNEKGEEIAEKQLGALMGFDTVDSLAKEWKARLNALEAME